MILIASKGHLWTQIPQPTQRSSDIIGLPLSPMMMVSSPARTRGQNLMHSFEQFFDLQRSRSNTAILMSFNNKTQRLILKRFYLIIF